MSQLNFSIVLLIAFAAGCWGHNLSCYQCVRFENQECNPDDLVTCAPRFDRCVTHIERDDTRGYMIKRECGLGPCAFEDNMASRGLGLDACDRSKSEYFCVSCCRTNGCNKSSANYLRSGLSILLIGFFFSCPISYII